MSKQVKVKLHFQRFEFKYLITSEEKKEIKKYLKRYVISDLFASKTNSGRYEVFSLYYDSPRYYYYQEKIDGVKIRKKIRLRTYRNDKKFVNYAFFEIKRKHDVVILKDRFLFSKDDYNKLIRNGDFHGTQAIRDQNKKNIIEEFEWERHLRSITPKILVAYVREPFVGRLNNNFRVTFDYNIQSIENNNLFYAGNDFSDVSRGMTVMEIKFNGVLPFYINEVIQQFNLQRIAYSKYCCGVESCCSLSLFEFPEQHFLQGYTFNNLSNSKLLWEMF